jgi:hypothetical protein
MFWLYYTNGVYKARKQYYVYASGDFIGDVGGYLGLCLGMSILTFYDGAVMLLVKAVGMTNKEKRKT